MTASEQINASYSDHHATNKRPAWLVDYQDAALARLLAVGLPTLADEDWRYTNLRELRDASLQPADGQRTSLDAARLSDDCGSVITMRSGEAIALPNDLPTGVRVLRLSDVGPDQLAPYLAADTSDSSAGLSLLNDAFAANALFIEIDANTRLSRPLVINWLYAQADGQLACPRLIVAAGSMSEACIVENRATAGGICNGLTQLALAPGATLNHYDIKRDLGESHNVGRIHARLQRDASAKFVSIALGGKLMRNDLDIELLAAGASAALHGVFLAAADEHVDNHTCVDHVGAHTQSDEDYRGVIGKLGHGVFNGKVIVRPDAQKINSAQSNDNILLDDSAEIDTKPELQIYADDVRCSHGATIGRISEEHLFYLRTRGIGEEDARSMLMQAFATSVLDLISEAQLRQELQALLAANMAAKFIEVAQ